MHIMISGKEFDRLTDAYINALNCVYLLDLLEHGAVTQSDEEYGAYAQENARSFVLDQLLTMLMKMKPVLKNASFKTSS